jgi:hypothetical protein
MIALNMALMAAVVVVAVAMLAWAMDAHSSPLS